MEAARGSMKSANSSGDSGHPCRVPLKSLNGFDISPLIMTDGVGELYRVLIQFMKYGGNPKCLREAKRKDQSTLSNAFSASRVATRNGVLFERAVFLWRLMRLNSLLVFSEECLPLMKPV